MVCNAFVHAVYHSKHPSHVEVTVSNSVWRKVLTEGMSVEVCAELAGGLQRDVIVWFQTVMRN